MAKLNSGTRIYGNVTVDTFITATGNITGGNILGGANVNATTHTGTTVSVTGNITGGNLITGALAQAATLSATGAVTFSGTTTNQAIGSSLTTGTLTMGGASGTGIITVGQSTASQTTNIQNGATGTGNTKTINLGVGGLAGSTTTIAIGPATATTAAATVTFNTATRVAIANTGGTALSVAGNITGGNVLGGANVNATTLTGTTVSVTGTITGGNLAVGSGTISTSGNITGGNVLGGANVNATTLTGTTVSVSGNVTGGNLITTGTANAATHTGTLVSVTGNITGGNVNTLGVGTFGNATPSAQLHVEQGSGSNIAYFRGNNAAVNSKVTLETTSNTSSIALTLINSGIGVAKQASFYLTSAGHISFQTNQTVGGEPTTGNAALVINTDSSITVNSGSATTAIVNGAANGVGNIGSSTVYFNTVFAKATSAQYADLAEKYTTDAEYAPGTVLSFGGSQEVTVTLTDADHRVAGVVSTNPATIMNAGLTSKHVATVALTGRVPCSVTGTVRKGDSMVSAGNGVARAEANPAVSTVIGKALEDFDGESGVIEVAVGVG